MSCEVMTNALQHPPTNNQEVRTQQGSPKRTGKPALVSGIFHSTWLIILLAADDAMGSQGRALESSTSLLAAHASCQAHARKHLEARAEESWGAQGKG